MRTVVARFLRSPLGLALLGIDAVVVLGLSLAGFLAVYLAIPLFLAAAAAEVLIAIQTKIGARSIVVEQDRQRDERDALALAAFAAARKRLSLLRVGDADIGAAVNRLVLAAGHYLENAVKRGERDPELEEAVVGSVEIIDNYLHLTDSRAETRRYRSDQALPADDNKSHALRMLNINVGLMEERLAILAGGLANGLGGPTVADREAARKELS